MNKVLKTYEDGTELTVLNLGATMLVGAAIAAGVAYVSCVLEDRRTRKAVDIAIKKDRFLRSKI